MRCMMKTAGDRDRGLVDEWSRLLGVSMYFVLLRMLNRGQPQWINRRHNTSIVGKDLDIGFESFLNNLHPVEMEGRWINRVMLVRARKTKFDRFLNQYGTFRFRFLLTRWSGIHGIVTCGLIDGRCPPIVRRGVGRVRHGRFRPLQILRRIYVEILVLLTDLDVSKILTEMQTDIE